MRYTEFIWDFDGTLFDTYAFITDTFRQGARSLGVELDERTALLLVKRSLVYASDVIGKEHGIDPSALLAAYMSHASPDAHAAAAPYEGMPALLHAIVASGGRNYLYTHSQAYILGALDHHGLLPLFADFITADHDFPSKPAPDALHYLLDKHGLDPANCVMLGDRDIDVNAGRNAGMAGALFDPDGFFDDFAADHLFRSASEIEAALVRG